MKHNAYISCDICQHKVGEISGIFRKVHVVRPFLKVPCYSFAIDKWELPVSCKEKKHICVDCIKSLCEDIDNRTDNKGQSK